MINHLHLKNFKAAEDLPLRFAPLTVLAGLNGSGKSSVLQSLSVLKQSTNVQGGDGLRLRGALVQLGTFEDVLTEGASSEMISMSISEGGKEFAWVMGGSSGDAYLPFQASPEQMPGVFGVGKFQLLPADRPVPRSLFARNSDPNADLGIFGPRGEYAVEYLLSSEARQIAVSDKRSCPQDGWGITPDLMKKVAPTNQLIDQVSGWMQQLSPGVRVKVSAISGIDDVALSFGYVGRSGLLESDRSIRPVNVGFGLTYSLPIVVACLTAEPGSLLLLENPEAHLHPQGQAALGQLLARTASEGVQVVVETHSDHVLNGIRLSVKRKFIDKDSVAIHYFTRSVSTGFVSSESPAVLANGRLSNWPKGFFDQWDMAIDELVKE